METGRRTCSRSHSCLHVNRITALLEFKTFLLTENRLRRHERQGGEYSAGAKERQIALVWKGEDPERNLIVVLGKPQERMLMELCHDASPKTENDIRLQLKLETKSDIERNNLFRYLA